MNKFLALIIPSVFASCAFAAEPAPASPAVPKTNQLEKMAACNKQAAGKKGDLRQAYMKQCLSASASADTSDSKAPSAAQQAQRDKMKSCNTDAQSMNSDERKKFMKTCLSK